MSRTEEQAAHIAGLWRPSWLDTFGPSPPTLDLPRPPAMPRPAVHLGVLQGELLHENAAVIQGCVPFVSLEGRQLPARPGDRRQGRQAPGLNHTRSNPDGGEIRWPPVGRKHGHQWGEMMAAVGEKQMAVDRGSRNPVRDPPAGEVGRNSPTSAENFSHTRLMSKPLVSAPGVTWPATPLSVLGELEGARARRSRVDVVRRVIRLTGSPARARAGQGQFGTPRSRPRRSDLTPGPAGAASR